MVEDTALPPRTPSRSWARLDVLVLFAIVAACSTALAAFSWSRGTTAAAAIEYRQTAGLSYAAPSGAPTIYGRTGLVTGDPVYLKAVSALRVTYAYSIAASGAPEGFTGAEQLVATVSNGLGLARDVPLEPVQHFAGSAFRTTATLDLATLEAVAATFDSFLGTPGASYTVSFSPNVVVRGRLGAAPLKAVFDEPTKFTMTSSELVPAGTTGASRSVAPGKGGDLRRRARPDRHEARLHPRGGRRSAGLRRARSRRSELLRGARARGAPPRVPDPPPASTRGGRLRSRRQRHPVPLPARGRRSVGSRPGRPRWLGHCAARRSRSVGRAGAGGPGCLGVRHDVLAEAPRPVPGRRPQPVPGLRPRPVPRRRPQPVPGLRPRRSRGDAPSRSPGGLPSRSPGDPFDHVRGGEHGECRGTGLPRLDRSHPQLQG